MHHKIDCRPDLTLEVLSMQATPRKHTSDGSICGERRRNEERESFQSETAEMEEEVDRWPEGGGGGTRLTPPDRKGGRCGARHHVRTKKSKAGGDRLDRDTVR